VLLVDVDVLVLLHDLEFFLSTSNAAASASAFSFRASSRSRARIRFVVASEARPSSLKASRHCSYAAWSTPSRRRKSVSSAPVRLLAFARIRIFSSIDQSRRGRFAGITGRLLASCAHRESVCWRRPVSDASCRALTASVPVKRATIFSLKARENGFVTELLPSRPADQPRKQATTILTLGAGNMGNRSQASCGMPWKWDRTHE
jgi:hypothetical protein